MLVEYRQWLFAFEMFSLVVFGTEYVLRIWSMPASPDYGGPVKGRLRWMVSWMGLVDLLAILPALVAFVDLRFLRVLRLLRLLKLGRYSTSLQVLTAVFRSRREALLMSVFIVGVALLVTSSLVYYVEHEAQPDAFPDILAAMWWSVMTLTTTGYGDIVPITAAGRVLGGLTALIGVGVIALPVGLLASGFMEEIKRMREDDCCPHCGERIHETPVAVTSGPLRPQP